MQDPYRILKSLLPPGHFWEIRRESAMDRLLKGLSVELERVITLADSLTELFSLQSLPRLARLLGLKSNSLLSVKSILARDGDLSREHVESRLKALSYTGFTIHDPTEDDWGLEPIVDPKLVGIIFVRSQVQAMQELSAEDPCESSLREWSNIPFETDVNQLLPAHVRAKFLYYPLKGDV